MSFFNLFSSFIITTISLYALKPVADRIGLVDFPGGRKTHDRATPMVGGLGIYLGTFSMCLFIPNIFSQYSALLALSAFVLFVGMIDDAKELRVSVRMGLHTMAASGWNHSGIFLDLVRSSSVCCQFRSRSSPPWVLSTASIWRTDWMAYPAAWL